MAAITYDGQVIGGGNPTTANQVAYKSSDVETALDSIQGSVDDILKYMVIMPNAGSHNCIYRGKFLGNTVTADQWNAISSSTFDDLYIGDYWTINNVNYRIAAFNYWLNTGDTACTTPHVVLVPDTALYNGQMAYTSSGQYESGSANTTQYGYYGSYMRSAGNATNGYAGALSTARTTVRNAFGQSHILVHREYLTNAATSYATSDAWYDSDVDLMNEIMTYGTQIFTNVINSTSVPNSFTIDKSQLPLFTFRHDLLTLHAHWWLRDVVSSADFALVDNNGIAAYNSASNSFGVRPAFAIC